MRWLAANHVGGPAPHVETGVIHPNRTEYPVVGRFGVI